MVIFHSKLLVYQRVSQRFTAEFLQRNVSRASIHNPPKFEQKIGREWTDHQGFEDQTMFLFINPSCWWFYYHYTIVSHRSDSQGGWRSACLIFGVASGLHQKASGLRKCVPEIVNGFLSIWNTTVRFVGWIDGLDWWVIHGLIPRTAWDAHPSGESRKISFFIYIYLCVYIYIPPHTHIYIYIYINVI
jgi:hypothetical protein